MAKLYNQKSVAVTKASLGSQGVVSFTYTGFNSSDAKNGFKIYDIDLVKQDLLNHFYIRKGEKLENPNFGTVIWDILFEPFTEEVKTIVSKDVEAIINYDPRISVNSVTVDSTEQGLRIEAEITYLPFNITEKMKFEFDRNNSVII
jgi:phage baseplate assembly protein W